jgi:hypothetical protein
MISDSELEQIRRSMRRVNVLTAAFIVSVIVGGIVFALVVL